MAPPVAASLLRANVSLAEARAHASVITRISVLGEFWGKPKNR